MPIVLPVKKKETEPLEPRAGSVRPKGGILQEILVSFGTGTSSCKSARVQRVAPGEYFQKVSWLFRLVILHQIVDFLGWRMVVTGKGPVSPIAAHVGGFQSRFVFSGLCSQPHISAAYSTMISTLEFC